MRATGTGYECNALLQRMERRSWTANRKMLNDVLRKEWGFNGVIISDYGAITDLHSIHEIAKDNQQAAAEAFNATVDIEAPNIVAINFTKTNKVW